MTATPRTPGEADGEPLVLDSGDGVIGRRQGGIRRVLGLLEEALLLGDLLEPVRGRAGIEAHHPAASSEIAMPIQMIVQVPLRIELILPAFPGLRCLEVRSGRRPPGGGRADLQVGPGAVGALLVDQVRPGEVDRADGQGGDDPLAEPDEHVHPRHGHRARSSG
jgi:hypothetical protein